MMEIKFQHNQLKNLRETLLKDLKNEHYAVLICLKVTYKQDTFFLVKDIIYPRKEDYTYSNLVGLKIDGKFMGSILKQIKNRVDADTIIEVHTHPFSEFGAFFSSTDTEDEKTFGKWLINNFKGSYGSIVLSQNDYLSRFWVIDGSFQETPIKSIIKTQTYRERIDSSDKRKSKKELNIDDKNIYNRSILTFGTDAILKIMDAQNITIVGVGGIGSVIAENLVHMGFKNLSLIDHDNSDVTNLNRMVGLTYDDALKEKPKVELVKEHILKINPNLNVSTFYKKIEEVDINEIIKSDFIVLATDNHYSRYLVQQLAFKYYIPMISVGVNISSKNGKITDISGEVITVRMGDKICLKCLKRLNYNEIAKVLSPDENVKVGLVQKGYVSGADVKEPAIKTLNSIMGAILVDVLLNQYLNNQQHHPIIVYENNHVPKIYFDEISVKTKNKECDVCDLWIIEL